MARTQILPTDLGAVKLWETEVSVEQKKKSYFNKMTGTEKMSYPVVRKTELESGPGDEVTMYLIAKMRGKPREGAEKIAGYEDKLNHFTDKMRIDKHRRAVNCGDIMDQKRVPFDIAEQVKARISDYAAEVHDEQITMTLAGARGVGNEIQHYPLGYAGFPNAFVAPDSGHLQYYDGTLVKNTIANTSKMSTLVIDSAKLKAQKMIGDIKSGNAAKMVPCAVDGGKHFVMLTGAEGMFDLRREVGDAGWLTLQKQVAAAEGKKSVIFSGGAGLYNGVLIDETETVVKFNDYGSGVNLQAMRSLFLGAHAAYVAYGTKGQTRGTRYELTESDLDHHEEEVVVMRLIAGYKKAQFNSMDFGVIAVDHYYTLAPGASI